jgi:hypothetical protein
MSAAHELLVSSRKKQGLPAALEDESAVEQIAMLLNVATPRPTSEGLPKNGSGTADAAVRAV